MLFASVRLLRQVWHTSAAEQLVQYWILQLMHVFTKSDVFIGHMQLPSDMINVVSAHKQELLVKVTFPVQF